LTVYTESGAAGGRRAHWSGFHIRRICSAALAWSAAASSPLLGQVGPDVIVGDIDQVNDYARLGDTAALSMRTVACNAGDAALAWLPLPSNQHPVIAQNMYRLKDDRLEQIGQAWLKHGFFALQSTACYEDCIPVPDGSGLGVHCSDPYTAGQNAGPFLGPRGEVNPFTGYFDGSTANDHAGHVHTPISHGLHVNHAELSSAGDRYFVEVQYVAPDDATWGNGGNNVSYREVAVSGSPTDWTFTNVELTAREEPAIYAWAGAAKRVLDLWPEDGRIIVAHRISDAGNGWFRYDYAVYNMDSERGIRSFSIPVGKAQVANVGFHAVLSHDEGWSNDPWPYEVNEGKVTWTTAAYADDPNANAIRWGTMYNFWFDADRIAVGSSATLGRFKPGVGSSFLVGWVRAPAAGDCNSNSVSDDQDIAEGTSVDCNVNGLPDECELQGNDCNDTQTPDDCDLSSGASLDCQLNGIPDECDIASGRSPDCNDDGVPDECEVFDDCNGNNLPDECELAGNDCDSNEIPDGCQNDCDRDGRIDPCEGEPDCNANGVPDSCDVNGLPGGPRTYNSGSLDLVIPDGDPSGVSHAMEIPVGGTILDVNVEVAIAHTWISDLIIALENSGTTVTLWDGACGAADDIEVLFDDEGGALVCGSPTVGVFRPTTTGGGFLGSLDGRDARGTWTLRMEDVIPVDEGRLLFWRLTVDTKAIPPTSPDKNQTGVPDECESCLALEDCQDNDPCTVDACVKGVCFNPWYPYGDMDHTGVVDVDDISCLVAGFANWSSCPGADIYPCVPEGAIDVDDLLAGIGAYAGIDPCCGS
jgi:subtilisin-like proprotein convertase family protein